MARQTRSSNHGNEDIRKYARKVPITAQTFGLPDATPNVRRTTEPSVVTIAVEDDDDAPPPSDVADSVHIPPTTHPTLGPEAEIAPGPIKSSPHEDDENEATVGDPIAATAVGEVPGENATTDPTVESDAAHDDERDGDTPMQEAPKTPSRARPENDTPHDHPPSADPEEHAELPPWPPSAATVCPTMDVAPCIPDVTPTLVNPLLRDREVTVTGSITQTVCVSIVPTAPPPDDEDDNASLLTLVRRKPPLIQPPAEADPDSISDTAWRCGRATYDKVAMEGLAWAKANGLPETIPGTNQKIIYQKNFTVGTGKHSITARVLCGDHRHKEDHLQCNKTRTFNDEFTQHFGNAEVIGFLGSWLQEGARDHMKTRAEHMKRANNPKPEQIRKFLVDHNFKFKDKSYGLV